MKTKIFLTWAVLLIAVCNLLVAQQTTPKRDRQAKQDSVLQATIIADSVKRAVKNQAKPITHTSVSEDEGIVLETEVSEVSSTPAHVASPIKPGLDSATQARIAQLSARNQLLEQENHRLAAAAKRRLTKDVYVDSFRNYLFYTCVIAPEKVSIQLFNRKGKKGKKVHDFATLDALAKQQGGTLIFAMNAGMYERNRLAKGLLIIDGQEQQLLDPKTKGHGNFYMQPNGVFALDSMMNAYVVPTQDYPTLADTNKILYATQSGPMMVIDGQINDKFNDGSPNRHIRNAVGVTPDNQVVFAISQRKVTFFELSSFMIQLGCTDALYLDGAISTSFMPEIGIGDLKSGGHLGPIFVIME